MRPITPGSEERPPRWRSRAQVLAAATSPAEPTTSRMAPSPDERREPAPDEPEARIGDHLGVGPQGRVQRSEARPERRLPTEGAIPQTDEPRRHSHLLQKAGPPHRGRRLGKQGGAHALGAAPQHLELLHGIAREPARDLSDLPSIHASGASHGLQPGAGASHSLWESRVHHLAACGVQGVPQPMGPRQGHEEPGAGGRLQPRPGLPAEEHGIQGEPQLREERAQLVLVGLMVRLVAVMHVAHH